MGVAPAEMSCPYKKLLAGPIATLVDSLLMASKVNGLDPSGLSVSACNGLCSRCCAGTGAHQGSGQSSLLNDGSNDLASAGSAERAGEVLGGHIGSIEDFERRGCEWKRSGREISGTSL